MTNEVTKSLADIDMETLVKQQIQIKQFGIRPTIAARTWGMSEDALRNVIRSGCLPQSGLIHALDTGKMYFTRTFVAEVQAMSHDERKQMDWWPKTQVEVNAEKQRLRIQEALEKEQAWEQEVKEGLALFTFGGTPMTMSIGEFCVPYTTEGVVAGDGFTMVFHPLYHLMHVTSKHSMYYDIYPIHSNKALKALYDAMIKSVEIDPKLQFDSPIAAFANDLVTFKAGIDALIDPARVERTLKVYKSDPKIYAELLESHIEYINGLADQVRAMFEIVNMKQIRESFGYAYPHLYQLIWKEPSGE